MYFPKIHETTSLNLYAVTWCDLAIPLKRQSPFFCLYLDRWALWLLWQAEWDENDAAKEPSVVFNWPRRFYFLPLISWLPCNCTASWDHDTVRSSSTWRSPRGWDTIQREKDTERQRTKEHRYKGTRYRGKNPSLRTWIHQPQLPQLMPYSSEVNYSDVQWSPEPFSNSWTTSHEQNKMVVVNYYFGGCLLLSIDYWYKPWQCFKII